MECWLEYNRQSGSFLWIGHGVRHWTQHLAGIIPFNLHQILLSGHRDYPHFADEGNCVFRTRELAQEHTLALQLPDLA